MGPEHPRFDYDKDTAHRDQILNDLTIIQTQSQLLMRRIEASDYADHAEVYQRLAVVVDAVRRLTELHRSS